MGKLRLRPENLRGFLRVYIRIGGLNFLKALLELGRGLLRGLQAERGLFQAVLGGRARS
jgi:hypothetical protein